MGRRASLAGVAALVAVTLAAAAGSPSSGVGQSGVVAPAAAPAPESAAQTQDLTTGLPAGMRLSLLASAPVDSYGPIHDRYPGSPVILRLQRIPVLPGSSPETFQSLGEGPWYTPRGPRLLYVERGELVFHAGEREPRTLRQGEWLYRSAERQERAEPTDYPYGMRNQSSACATLLVLEVGAEPGSGAGGGVESTAEPPDYTCGGAAWLEGSDPDWPALPAVLFVAEATWDPAYRARDLAYAGPVGLLVDAGALRVGPSFASEAWTGVTAGAASGGWIVVPGGLRHGEENLDPAGEAAPARGLLVGVVPAGGPLVLPPEEG